MGCRQELEESGWSGSPPGMASRSLGRLKRSVIWTGIGKVFPLACAEAGCRDRSRVFLWGGDGGGTGQGSGGPSAWSHQTPPSQGHRNSRWTLEATSAIWSPSSASRNQDGRVLPPAHPGTTEAKMREGGGRREEVKWGTYSPPLSLESQGGTQEVRSWWGSWPLS